MKSISVEIAPFNWLNPAEGFYLVVRTAANNPDGFSKLPPVYEVDGKPMTFKDCLELLARIESFIVPI